MDNFNMEGYITKTRHYQDGGVCYSFEFYNGYGAQVARNPRTGGYEKNLWELGVTFGKKLVFDTPITPGEKETISWLSETEVENLLKQIQELPVKRHL